MSKSLPISRVFYFFQKISTSVTFSPCSFKFSSLHVLLMLPPPPPLLQFAMQQQAAIHIHNLTSQTSVVEHLYINVIGSSAIAMRTYAQTSTFKQQCSTGSSINYMMSAALPSLLPYQQHMLQQVLLPLFPPNDPPHPPPVT